MTCQKTHLNLFVESNQILCIAPTCKYNSTVCNVFTQVLREGSEMQIALGSWEGWFWKGM